MTSSEAVGSAQGLNEGSKHWANFVHRQKLMMTLRKRSKHFANFLYHPRMERGKEQRASDAEDLFFEWFIGGP